MQKNFFLFCEINERKSIKIFVFLSLTFVRKIVFLFLVVQMFEWPNILYDRNDVMKYDIHALGIEEYMKLEGKNYFWITVTLFS